MDSQDGPETVRSVLPRGAGAEWTTVGKRWQQQRELKVLSFQLPGEAGPGPWARNGALDAGKGEGGDT